jgi:hypothetical protein
MAKSPIIETKPEPIPGIRSELAKLKPSDGHAACALKLGHSADSLIHQIDNSLLDALAGLRQLESTTGGVGADKINELISRLS